MANEILEKIDEFGQAVHDMRKLNDERLEKLEQGSEARAKELEVQTDRANAKIDSAQKMLKDLAEEKERVTTRLEILEIGIGDSHIDHFPDSASVNGFLMKRRMSR